ncbi:MAG: frataxin family protein [Alphaproteobacteria bacterium]|nr:frataxin family protein [Alphaproteobacteria bacterium]
MDETRYHMIADATLLHCFDRLNGAFESGALDDLELQHGILTLRSVGGRTYLLSKHAPSQQLWYASPTLGGLHFRFDETAGDWHLPDGRPLYDILHTELRGENIAVAL